MPEIRNQVQLSASASIEVQQDLLTLSLSTTREGSDPAVLQTQLRQALDAALGIAKASAQTGAMDVRTGQFSLQPRYGREGKITGWVGMTELVIEGCDLARMGTTAARIPTLVISNASFGLSRDVRARVESEAQSGAIERFKARAGEIAKSFGFSGFTLREVAVSANDVGYVPRPRLMAFAEKAMAADASVPLESGKATVTMTVSGTVQLQ